MIENENEVLVQSLFDHIDSYERYIKDLEKNPSQVKIIFHCTLFSVVVFSLFMSILLYTVPGKSDS